MHNPSGRPRHEVPPAERETLAVGLHAGSEAALEQIYRHWTSLVYTIAYRRVGNLTDAEDITQQVFLGAWRSRHTLRPSPTALPGWLLGITRNIIANTLQARSRDKRRAEVAADAVRRDQVSETTDNILALAVLFELEAMGNPRGDVLRKSLFEGRTQAEIADELNLPLGTVKSHARRGLAQLRDQLQDVDDAE